MGTATPPCWQVTLHHDYSLAAVQYVVSGDSYSAMLDLRREPLLHMGLSETVRRTMLMLWRRLAGGLSGVSTACA